MGAVYSAFLWFVCSTRPGVMSAILLFVSQIAIGFPATRAYYDLGSSNRENLHFIDPAKFNGNGKKHDVEIHLGEIPLLFEKIDLQIRKYDLGSLDDLSDIAWFGIFVWSAYSSTSFFFRTSSIPQCLIGTIVLLASCLGSYLSGYWTRRNFEFEDDLSHLQYYVENEKVEFSQIETILKEKLGENPETYISLHADKNVPIGKVVEIMNIAKDNNYKLILATAPIKKQ